MKKHEIDLMFNEDQEITCVGEHAAAQEGNWGSTDTSYPAEPACFIISEIIWHKRWGGRIIDIVITELLPSDTIAELEDECLTQI